MVEFERLDHIRENLDRLVSEIRAARRILVTMHCRPDGDAAGSAIAMYHALKALDKAVTVYNVDKIPSNFSFLQGSEVIVHEIDPSAFDLCLVLDCAEPGLLGRKFPYDALTCPCAFVDHHSIPYEQCLVNVHDSKASAAGEILFHVIRALGVPMTQEIAAALYTSIITDTGSFRYTSTTPDAMKVSAYLLETGIDVWDICSHIYEDNPIQKLRLLSLVLQTLWVSKDGKIAFMHANRQMLRRCHCSGAMTDGFINYARSIHGVEVSIFLTQLEDELYRISFRSRGHLDVSEVASSFGGGGHKNAAACTIAGNVETIREQIIKVFEEKLGKD